MRVVLLGLLLLLSGCAHTFVIEKGAPPERYDEAQGFLHQKPAKLVLKTNKTFRATDLHIGPDSTVFRIDGATDRIVMMNDRIRSIATQDVRKGTRDGAIVGGITGGVMGLLIGVLIAAMDSDYICETGPEEEDYDWSCGRGDNKKDGLVIMAGMGTGILAGGLLGALIGSQAGTLRTVEYYKDPWSPQRWEYLPR